MRVTPFVLLTALLACVASATAQEPVKPPEQKQDQAPSQPDAKAQPQTRNQVFNPSNGNSFFDFCRSGTQQKQICIVYVKGLLDGAQLQASMTKQKQAYCQPRGSSPEQAIDILLKFMTDNPGDRHRDARLLAFAALKAAWPCPAGGGGLQL
jgi:hypothetical protein